MACERPSEKARSLSQWDCEELARQLERDAIVKSISGQTVRRILAHHKLKPWRCHMWLHQAKVDDIAFKTKVGELIELYTRALGAGEIVLSLDEKTSLQPRRRTHPTRPAMAGNKPNLLEHNYERCGALQLFAAFDTRSGKVWGKSFRRKRQVEFIEFVSYLEEQIAPGVQTIHIVCDNLKVHSGKKVRAWLEKHPRFVFHFTPVHCSWMNQIEQWFSILQRKRLRIADFENLEALAAELELFIAQWNERAHPFNWSSKSVAKIMAESSPLELAA